MSKCCHNSLNTKNKDSYNRFHNIFRLFDVLPNFPLTASGTMCDYKHSTYELLHELPKKIRKYQESVAQSPPKCFVKNFVNTSKKLLKNRN